MLLSGEAELVSEWIGLPGEANNVKRFERSNGLDTALYKNYLFNKRTGLVGGVLRQSQYYPTLLDRTLLKGNKLTDIVQNKNRICMDPVQKAYSDVRNKQY